MIVKGQKNMPRNGFMISRQKILTAPKRQIFMKVGGRLIAAKLPEKITEKHLELPQHIQDEKRPPLLVAFSKAPHMLR